MARQATSTSFFSPFPSYDIDAAHNDCAITLPVMYFECEKNENPQYFKAIGEKFVILRRDNHQYFRL